MHHTPDRQNHLRPLNKRRIISTVIIIITIVVVLVVKEKQLDLKEVMVPSTSRKEGITTVLAPDMMGI